MLPLMYTGLQDRYLPDDHPKPPPTRLDVQRQYLEHTRMYNLNTMVVDQTMTNIDRQLVRRQQILEATANQLTLTERLRQRIATFLINTGERIEPDACLQEPRFNA